MNLVHTKHSISLIGLQYIKDLCAADYKTVELAVKDK